MSSYISNGGVKSSVYCNSQVTPSRTVGVICPKEDFQCILISKFVISYYRKVINFNTNMWRLSLIPLFTKLIKLNAIQSRLYSTHQKKIGLTIYWAWPWQSEADPVSPSVSLSHQETFISLLSFSIWGQTDWKPQSWKSNQSDHMDHSLV